MPQLPVVVLTLRCMLILFMRAVIRHVPFFSTTKAFVGGVRGTSFHGSRIGVPLTWHLLTTLLLTLLSLMLKLIALRVWSTVPLIRWPLVPLLGALWRIVALTSVAFRGLSLKPLPFSIHLLALIVNHNSVIHERLEVGVCIGHKLELETIIQTLKKATMFISIINHLIRSIT